MSMQLIYDFLSYSLETTPAWLTCQIITDEKLGTEGTGYLLFTVSETDRKISIKTWDCHQAVNNLLYIIVPVQLSSTVSDLSSLYQCEVQLKFDISQQTLW